MEQLEERCQTTEDRRDFITSHCRVVKHSTVHRSRIGDKMKLKTDRKDPRVVEPLDTSIHIREEGPPVQLCEDSNVAEKWINGHHAMGQKYRGKIGHVQKTLHSLWKKKSACPATQIDDYVRHIFREHNQESDHLANLGADGQSKIVVEK